MKRNNKLRRSLILGGVLAIGVTANPFNLNTINARAISSDKNESTERVDSRYELIKKSETKLGAIYSDYQIIDDKIVVHDSNNIIFLNQDGTESHRISRDDLSLIEAKLEKIVPVEDGLIVRGTAYIDDAKKYTRSFIAKLDKDGNEVWVNHFKNNSFTLTDMLVLSDGSILVSNHMGVYNKIANTILKFDKDGNQQSFDLPEHSLDKFIGAKLTMLDNNEVLLTGQSQLDSGTFASFIKYDLNTNTIKAEKKLTEKVLNLNVITDRMYGVADDAVTSMKNKVNIYNINGELLKVIDCGEDIKRINNVYPSNNGGIYVHIYNSFDGSKPNLLNKYDKDGNLLSSVEMDSTFDNVRTIKELPNGDIAIINGNTLSIYSIEKNVPKLSATDDLNIQVVADNTLEMALSTNQITFDGYNGTENLENNELNITVSSGLSYDLSATMMDEFKGTADTSAILPKENFTVKTSTDTEYKEFETIGEKVVLVTNAPHGKDKVHNINFKLKGDSSVKADTYNTTLKFEAVQK